MLSFHKGGEGDLGPKVKADLATKLICKKCRTPLTQFDSCECMWWPQPTLFHWPHQLTHFTPATGYSHSPRSGVKRSNRRSQWRPSHTFTCIGLGERHLFYTGISGWIKPEARPPFPEFQQGNTSRLELGVALQCFKGCNKMQCPLIS